LKLLQSVTVKVMRNF